jgi:hypothetical protein
VNQFNSLAEGKAVIVSPGFRSRKDIGLPLLEQIHIPKNDRDSEITNIKTWYETQQQFVSKSTLREPAGEELERRMLEAEKLLPLVDKKSEIRDKLKGV